MGFFVFDLDGTLAEISHRRHFVEPPARRWAEFFEACDRDTIIPGVRDVLLNLMRGGNRVEIWSARGGEVEEKTRVWLETNGIPREVLKRMRPIGENMPDEKLKRLWLHEEIAQGTKPDVIFDDRQKVVDMWRAEGVECFQVNPGDFDTPKHVRAHDLYLTGRVPILTLMVGPAGSGKSTIAKRLFDPQCVISSDNVRKYLCLDREDQSRDAAVWVAISLLVKARMTGGLPTIIDATNVRRKDRVTLAALVPQEMACAYLVIDRPLEEIEKTAGKRLDVVKRTKGQEMSLVKRHDEVFRANLKDIRKGDGLPNVQVYMGPDAYVEGLHTLKAAYKAALAERAAGQVSEGLDQAGGEAVDPPSL